MRIPSLLCIALLIEAKHYKFMQKQTITLSHVAKWASEFSKEKG